MIEKTVASEKAQDNAAALRKLYNAGVQSRNRLARLQRTDAAAIRYGRKAETFKAEAARLNTNIDTAKKMRRLADEYTPEQVEALCEAAQSPLLLLLRQPLADTLACRGS